MKQSSNIGGFSGGNPIANVFVVIVGVLAIAASVVLGFFAFVILGSIVLIMASVIGLRVWWFKRKLGGQAGPGNPPQSNRPGGVIEGEFQVVADEREDE